MNLVFNQLETFVNLLQRLQKKEVKVDSKLLLYRFEKGEGLKGHNLGNLILTALQDMAGSTTSALEIAERIFPVRRKNISCYYGRCST